MALVKYESYETGHNNYMVMSGAGAGQFEDAQIFAPVTAHYISRVDVLFYRVGTVDEATIELRGTSGGAPLGGIAAYGEALASATADVSGVTTATSGTWVTFTFDTPVSLTAGTSYAIVIASNVWDVGVNELRWRLDTTGSYTRGVVYAYVDAAWTEYATYDFMFREYGELTVAGNPPPAINVSYSKKLVAVGANEFWYESSAGTMYELADANGDIDVTEGLDIFELYGKVFVVNDSNLKVADFINVRLHTTDIKPADKVYPRHGTVIKATGGAASGAQMVVDYITALDGDTYIYGKLITPDETFLDTDVCTVTITEGDVSFTLDADQVTGPFWYDWKVYGDNTAGYGALPNKATLGCNYCGRAVISGNPEAPHQWYMTREGHPFDALYAGQDAQSAVAGGNSDAGEIGDIVTALIPCNDDFLIFGCASTIWFLIGNPCDGGSINEFDLTTGIYGGKSWCFGDAGNLYFWGANGLYKTTVPGKPICISEIKLPNLIKDLVGGEKIDNSTHRITLAYDRDRAGILVCITKIDDGVNSNYFYDLRTEGFFPEDYPTTKAVYSAFYYEATDSDYKGLLLGCTDGYLRVFDETSENDDDTLIDSYVTFAPLPMSSDPKLTGKLTGLDIISAGGGANGSQSDSDDIDFKVFTANAAEQTIEKLYANTNPNISGTIKAPGRRRGCTIRKKVKGVYMGIRIGNNTEDETWAFEQLLYDTKNAGRLK